MESRPPVFARFSRSRDLQVLTRPLAGPPQFTDPKREISTVFSRLLLQASVIKSSCSGHANCNQLLIPSQSLMSFVVSC